MYGNNKGAAENKMLEISIAIGRTRFTSRTMISERMSIWFKASWLLIVILHSCAHAQDLPEVQTTHGKIVGYVQEMFGKKIKTYLGIPFAMPPIGSLRFKRPLPAESWEGVLNTSSWHNACFQMPFLSFVDKVGEEGEAIWNPKTPMSEDCLYLNIWVPVNREIPVKSTMVWIFGGGFVTGTSALELYDGTALAAYADIIVVSINYRLGPLGFLYFGNEEAPGNVGLLDQVLALQWINKNIENFGGVPNDITLFGESAGAASVSYHLMSEMSQPLFQRAIMQSGTCLSHWAHVTPETALAYAKLLAKEMNCSSGDEGDSLHCLQHADAKTMSDYQWRLPITFLTFPIVPTTDNHFIKQSPKEFLRAGRFPNKSLLMGVNSDESVYFLNYYLFDKIDWPSSHLNRSLFLDSIPMVVSDNGLSKVVADRRHRPLVDSILQQYETEYLPGAAKNYMNILDDIGMALELPNYPWEAPELPNYPWEALELPTYPWEVLELPNYPWEALELPTYQWMALELPKYPWEALELPTYPWEVLELPNYPWEALELPTYQWMALELPTNPWKALELLNYPWEALELLN
ncbi:cholinesterase 1-like [Ylistrum balloti]|uniref:cholinesterase 1-like n=1 Tax=Ylistrum balloti TaxID=509963 RepID=UPI0029058EED|nr:cholinesterase 1-like [Ylistrum balloti]